MSAAQIVRTPDPEVQGYCVHCRSRRPMQGAIQVCNRRGGRDLKGHCAVCGKSMYRLGGWDSLAAAAQKVSVMASESTGDASQGEISS
jgi:Domain of unknown function (DUF5679)